MTDLHPAMMDHVRYVRYDEQGRITGGGQQGRYFVELDAVRGQRVAICELELLPGNLDDASSYYVRAGAVLPRPNAPDYVTGVGTLYLAPGAEADLFECPAARVDISGPVTTTVWHPGGVLSLGFAVPGVYAVSVEVWPHKPAVVTVIVGKP